MRHDSELTLLLVCVISGMFWFVLRFFWFVGESIVRSIKGAFPHDEHPVDWHGQAPPVLQDFSRPFRPHAPILPLPSVCGHYLCESR